MEYLSIFKIKADNFLKIPKIWHILVIGNIEQLEGLINTTIYLSGVTIIEGDDPIEAESKETD